MISMKNGGAIAVFVLMLFLAAPLARAQDDSSVFAAPDVSVPAPQVQAPVINQDSGGNYTATEGDDANGTNATPSSGANTSQTFVPLAPIPNLTQGGVAANTAGLAQFLNNLYVYLIGLAAVLAVIEIIIGGLEIATQDSVSKHAQGRSRIQQAVFGLVLVLSPVVVFSIINPGILNLSLAIPPIDLTTPPFSSCTNPQGCTPAPVSSTSGFGNSITSAQTILFCATNCSAEAKKCTAVTSSGFYTASGKAEAVCSNGSLYTGGSPGVIAPPASCPSGSKPAILCTTTTVSTGITY